MATKTVTNANMLNTQKHGISIHIDQDKSLERVHVQQQQQEQKQQESGKQLLPCNKEEQLEWEPARITIVQSTFATQTQKTLQQDPPKFATQTTTITTATKKKANLAKPTLIDINRNNVENRNVALSNVFVHNHAANDAANQHVAADDSHVDNDVHVAGAEEIAKETGYTTIATFPHLLLRVASPTGPTTTIKTTTTTTTTQSAPVTTETDNTRPEKCKNSRNEEKSPTPMLRDIVEREEIPQTEQFVRDSIANNKNIYGNGQSNRNSNNDNGNFVRVGADNEVGHNSKIQIIQCNSNSSGNSNSNINSYNKNNNNSERNGSIRPQNSNKTNNTFTLGLPVVGNALLGGDVNFTNDHTAALRDGHDDGLHIIEATTTTASTTTTTTTTPTKSNGVDEESGQRQCQRQRECAGVGVGVRVSAFNSGGFHNCAALADELVVGAANVGENDGNPRPDLEFEELENACAAFEAFECHSLTTKADCVSAVTNATRQNQGSTETIEQTNGSQRENSHVVKIQINQPLKPTQPNRTTHTVSKKIVTPLEAQHYPSAGEKRESSIRLEKLEKQISVVTLNESACAPETRPLLQELAQINMVQRSCGASTASTHVTTPQNPNPGGHTSVTEVNVSNASPYLYYMMSSGQFSPCDTLDSGTGSDVECNAQSSVPSRAAHGSGHSANGTANGGAPKLEMHLKTTKIRVSNPAKCADRNGDHQRASSLTDSEESESSSLSCDSLHSAEYMRHCSASASASPSPSPTNKSVGRANGKILSSLLPDSLLRDIRDRKFPTNDFESKYGRPSVESVNEQDYCEVQSAVERAKYAQNLNTTNNHNNNNNNNNRSNNMNNINGNNDSVGDKRSSLPNKTFVLNTADGTFVDTKMNSMPRKYEADKYYNFHVNEHENFRSFGNSHTNGTANGASIGIGGAGSDDTVSLSEYDVRNLHDDDFAGYKDIRCGSATSTIRSSKGTVRGVKNRVRNGIATFLQLQQPHVKNYMEKDLGKVVLYTTSMGIIRDTYAKCANVKQILRTLLIKFEERDVFMSVEYQQEIKERMHSDTIRVPQLFVEGQHIGDAEAVERLNESGELRQLLKPYKSIATTYTCQTCGGYRLLPCPSCNGSKKSVHRNHFTAEFVALKCMNCDEVGLVKCHNC